MPEAESTQLRLYCICGQKMRVSENMFGKPGKCVACRQKIRIPRLDQFPTDSTEMFLKDYPEFLRTPPKSRRKTALESAEPDSDSEELPILGEAPETLPLEELPVLRELCSLEYKIERKLREMDRKAVKSTVDKASLMSYRNMARKARAALDERMRAALEDVRDQITAVEEEIARCSLDVRTGKLAYLAYYRQVTELRNRREWAVRLHHNLRAWLQTKSPFLAGGYLDLPLENIPIEAPEYRIPPAPETEQLMVHLAVEELRSALKERESIARQKLESERMAKSGSLIGTPLEHTNAEAEAARRRTAARVGFARVRLEQVVQDCESDAKALKAQLKLSQERLSEKSMSRGAYQNLEMDLLRAQSDNSKAHDLARRALNANTASDVPRLQGTFLLRMRKPRKAAGLGMDSYLAWGSVILMLLSIFVPLLPEAPGGNSVVMPGFAMGLFVFAMLTAMSAAVPVRPVRACLLNALFCVGALGLLAHFYYQLHAATAAGAAMRINERWYASWGMLVLLMAVATGASAGAASAVGGGRRLWPVSALALGAPLAVLLSLGTPLFSVFSVQASITPAEIQLAVSELGAYNASVGVRNSGWRTFWLADHEGAESGNSLQLVVERRVGRNSWQDAGLPLSMKLEDSHWWDPFAENTFPPVEVAPGKAATFRFALLPGSYRVQLIERGATVEPRTSTFEVPESMAVTDEIRQPPSDVLPPEDDVPGGPQAAKTPASSGSKAVQMELDGVVYGKDRTPLFLINLAIPGSRSTSQYKQLGDQIQGQWVAQEFNPQTQKLTVSNGKTLLVVGTGEQIDLLEPEEGEAPN